MARIIERAEMLDKDSTIPLDEKRLLLAEFIEQGRRPNWKSRRARPSLTPPAAFGSPRSLRR